MTLLIVSLIITYTVTIVASAFWPELWLAGYVASCIMRTRILVAYAKLRSLRG